MIKQRICLFYSIFLLLSWTILSNSTFAASIGELYTIDGEKFELSQFGTKENQKHYFLKTASRFIPIEEVKHITRINTQRGRFAYLIVLLNGDFEKGRQGLLFYENVSFVDPSNGKSKTAFTPVIKDRQQSGLIFTTLESNNKTEKVIEIGYPNNIDRISLYFKDQQAKPITKTLNNSDSYDQKLVKQNNWK